MIAYGSWLDSARLFSLGSFMQLQSQGGWDCNLLRHLTQSHLARGLGRHRQLKAGVTCTVLHLFLALCRISMEYLDHGGFRWYSYISLRSGSELQSRASHNASTQCHFHHIYLWRPSQRLSAFRGSDIAWWVDTLNHHSHFQVRINTFPYTYILTHTPNSLQAFHYLGVMDFQYAFRTAHISLICITSTDKLKWSFIEWNYNELE